MPFEEAPTRRSSTSSSGSASSPAALHSATALSGASPTSSPLPPRPREAPARGCGQPRRRAVPPRRRSRSATPARAGTRAGAGRAPAPRACLHSTRAPAAAIACASSTSARSSRLNAIRAGAPRPSSPPARGRARGPKSGRTSPASSRRSALPAPLPEVGRTKTAAARPVEEDGKPELVPDPAASSRETSTARRAPPAPRAGRSGRRLRRRCAGGCRRAREVDRARLRSRSRRAARPRGPLVRDEREHGAVMVGVGVDVEHLRPAAERLPDRRDRREIRFPRCSGRTSSTRLLYAEPDVGRPSVTPDPSTAAPPPRRYASIRALQRDLAFCRLAWRRDPLESPPVCTHGRPPRLPLTARRPASSRAPRARPGAAARDGRRAAGSSSTEDALSTPPSTAPRDALLSRPGGRARRRTPTPAERRLCALMARRGFRSSVPARAHRRRARCPGDRRRDVR